MRRNSGFTLIELLVVIAIIFLLAALLLPVFSSAREKARQAACLSSMKQIGMAARLYMDDNEGALYHHHEEWVLDDGTQTPNLPATVDGCTGGGQGNSNAEKPWVIFFQPYLKSRTVAFCPSDPALHSQRLVTNIFDYNGGVTALGQECQAAPQGEQCLAEENGWAMESYLLNSIFTHKSCRYAMERALPGFATDAVITALPNPSVILFSERNSTALDDPGNSDFGYISQDDYDTWPGESALVRWGGSGSYADQGWISYSRHNGGANYIYADGHVRWMHWSQARFDQYPDHVVRFPLANPPA